jgi:hypothetical protein
LRATLACPASLLGGAIDNGHEQLGIERLLEHDEHGRVCRAVSITAALAPLDSGEKAISAYYFKWRPQRETRCLD